MQFVVSFTVSFVVCGGLLCGICWVLFVDGLLSNVSWVSFVESLLSHLLSHLLSSFIEQRLVAVGCRLLGVICHASFAGYRFLCVI